LSLIMFSVECGRTWNTARMFAEQPLEPTLNFGKDVEKLFEFFSNLIHVSYTICISFRLKHVIF
jgi:hypothetical protein